MGKNASALVAVLALVFCVLAIFTVVPLWVSVICLCVAVCLPQIL